MSSKTIQITSLLAALMLGLASPAFAQQDSSNSNNNESSSSTDAVSGSSQKGGPDDATGSTTNNTTVIPPTGHSNAPAASECPPGQTKSATTNMCESK